MVRQSNERRWLGIALIAIACALAAACAGGSASKPAARTAGGSAGQKSANGAISNDADNRSSQPAEPPSAAIGSTELQPSDAAGARSAGSAQTGSSGTGANGNANPAGLPSQLDRKIIMTATLDLATDAVSKRYEDVGNIASSAGGFIASSTFGSSGDQQTASVTIRVPAASYQQALNDLRKLGDVKGEQSNANDVTEEYTDLQSRLRNLKATQEQYLAFLLKAADITQVLAVQDRLNSTRADIEQVQGRINLVDHQSDLATITVHLSPPFVAKTDQPNKTAKHGPLEVAADSFEASLAVLVGIATVMLAVAAFSWWLVPVLAVAYLIARRQRTPRAAAASDPPSASA